MTEPVFTFVGGGASVGMAFACAWALGRENPQWDKAMAGGATLGAIIGAALMLLDASMDGR